MGRYVFGVAALLLGVASLVLHDQLISEWRLPGVAAFITVTSILQIIGGALLLSRRSSRAGAIILGIVYLVFSLTFVPDIVAAPRIYATWGNVFYGLALVAGAAVAYGLASSSLAYVRTICRTAVIVFGLCNVSFAIEQVEFLTRTISLVPKWIPLGGMFWAIITTAAFGLAGIALVVGRASLLAARLVALMLIVFVLTIWIPILIVAPNTHSNWSEGIETFAIAASAWLAAEFLRRKPAATYEKGP